MNTWNRLSEKDKDPFTHPVWLTSWLKHFGRHNSGSSQIYAFYHNGRFVGAVPFRINKKRTFAGTQYRLSHPFNADIGGASLALDRRYHEPVFDALFNLPVKNGKKPLMVLFQRVDKTHAIIETSLNTSLSPKKIRYIVDLRKGYDAVKIGFSKNFKKNLKKSQNKINKIKGLKISEITDKSAMVHGFRKLTEMESSGWKGRNGTAIRQDRDVLNYFSMVVDGLSDSGRAALYTMESDGELICGYFFYFENVTAHAVKTAYNEKYANLSPGNILLDAIFTQFFPPRKIKYCNAIGKPVYIERFRPGSLNTYEVRVFPPGLRGLCGKILFFSFSNFVKKALLALGIMDRIKKFIKGRRSFSF